MVFAFLPAAYQSAFGLLPPLSTLGIIIKKDLVILISVQGHLVSICVWLLIATDVDHDFLCSFTSTYLLWPNLQIFYPFLPFFISIFHCFKVFFNIYVFVFIYLAVSGLSCGMRDLVPHPGMEPVSRVWAEGCLTSGPPGEVLSLSFCLLQFLLLPFHFPELFWIVCAFFFKVFLLNVSIVFWLHQFLVES